MNSEKQARELEALAAAALEEAAFAEEQVRILETLIQECKERGIDPRTVKYAKTP